MVSSNAYQAARQAAAMIGRSDRGRLIVSGADRASYLHGLLTNDITALAAGKGCYAAYLTPQGRMIADLFVYELGDAMLVTVPREQTTVVLAKLDQFVFSEDVQLADVTDRWSTIAVVGPDAAKVVGEITGEAAAVLHQLSEHGNRRVHFRGDSAIVTRVTDTGEPGYDLHVETAYGEALRRTLLDAGVAELDDATAETVRIEAGIPRFNRDMDDDTIPLEAGIESRAISFSKGCYVGQEVIVRVLHRGHGRVARKLVGLIFDDGRIPASGATVMRGDREIGHITSSAASPALARAIALAYVHRDFVEEGTRVSATDLPASVTKLPFVHRDGM
jgi:folate-binding protein YgfZ